MDHKQALDKVQEIRLASDKLAIQVSDLNELVQTMVRDDDVSILEEIKSLASTIREIAEKIKTELETLKNSAPGNLRRMTELFYQEHKGVIDRVIADLNFMA